MNLTWFIDVDLIAELHPGLPAHIKSLGHDVIKMSSALDHPTVSLETDRMYTFLGSFQELKNLERHKIPVATYGLGKTILRSVYVSYLPNEWFLNSDSLMTTWSLLKAQQNTFFDGFDPNEWFIRPDSGRKTFTGQVITTENIGREMKFLESHSGVAPETIIWICPAKSIGAEYRFWISAGKVVTYSEYAWNSAELTYSAPSQAIQDLARKVAECSWQADLIYTVDICEYDRKAKIIELNSFSCAGLYQCDSFKLIETVSKDMLSEWDD